ncbi:MAG TPA: cytochrome C [Blastocatellia bacterium]|nr:cytochrome C [Blastocatellia bacterium]
MNRIAKIGILCATVSLFVALSVSTASQTKSAPSAPGLDEQKRIQKGFEIAPVPLDFKVKDRNRVGLGSYIVNAQAACNDCHTCPSYEPGHDPFAGGDGKINAANYLAGGVPFPGGIVSANITPDVSGKPAGLEFEEYLQLIRTGHDPDEPDEILQVMPWPIFRNMNDNDIHAIYDYLSSIPHAEPGSCNRPGQ